MAGKRFNDPIEPMTLANMRHNDVRSLDVQCSAATCGLPSAMLRGCGL
jgi:hypothetical protein